MVMGVDETGQQDLPGQVDDGIGRGRDDASNPTFLMMPSSA